MGVLIAMVLGMGQVNYLTDTVEKPTVEQNEDENQDTSDEIIIVSAVDAISTSAQLVISHVFYFISENILSDSPKINSGYFEKPYLVSYLTTIFRQIISPNAP